MLCRSHRFGYEDHRTMTKFTEAEVRNISEKAGYEVAQDFGGKSKVPLALSAGEELMALMIDAFNVQEPVREYRFHAKRRWRFDFAWPDAKFAVEVEGLTREGGRHQRFGGFEKDCEKYEAAMLDGWTVYRVTHARIKSGGAVSVINAMLDRLSVAVDQEHTN